MAGSLLAHRSKLILARRSSICAAFCMSDVASSSIHTTSGQTSPSCTGQWRVAAVKRPFRSSQPRRVLVQAQRQSQEGRPLRTISPMPDEVTAPSLDPQRGLLRYSPCRLVACPLAVGVLQGQRRDDRTLKNARLCPHPLAGQDRLIIFRTQQAVSRMQQALHWSLVLAPGAPPSLCDGLGCACPAST